MPSFTIATPDYYNLTGSINTYKHSIIQVNDCQADYSATLTNSDLMDYDPLTQTLTVSSSDKSLENIYTVTFSAELKQCTEPRLDGQHVNLNFVLSAIAPLKPLNDDDPIVTDKVANETCIIEKTWFVQDGIHENIRINADFSIKIPELR